MGRIPVWPNSCLTLAPQRHSLTRSLLNLPTPASRLPSPDFARRRRHASRARAARRRRRASRPRPPLDRAHSRTARSRDFARSRRWRQLRKIMSQPEQQQGLYRYRLGDVVQVAGFYNATPKLKFVCRRNLMLSINIDKNSEQDLQIAVDSAATKILAAEKLEVVDYTSHADTCSDPGHYVIFWELNADASDEVLQGCCDELDRAFVDAGYVGSRKAGAIGPLELRVLQRGTFQKVLRHYLSLGAPVSQFKSPRCVARSNTSVLQILSGNTVKAFFCTALD